MPVGEESLYTVRRIQSGRLCPVLQIHANVCLQAEIQVRWLQWRPFGSQNKHLAHTRSFQQQFGPAGFISRQELGEQVEGMLPSCLGMLRRDDQRTPGTYGWYSLSSHLGRLAVLARHHGWNDGKAALPGPHLLPDQSATLHEICLQEMPAQRNVVPERTLPRVDQL